MSSNGDAYEMEEIVKLKAWMAVLNAREKSLRSYLLWLHQTHQISTPNDVRLDDHLSHLGEIELDHFLSSVADGDPKLASEIKRCIEINKQSDS